MQQNKGDTGEAGDGRLVVQQRAGSESYPLLQEGSRKALILVLDGRWRGGWRGDDLRMLMTKKMVTRRQRSWGDGGDENVDAEPSRRLDEDDAERVLDEQNARAVNDEQAEYTMTEATAMRLEKTVRRWVQRERCGIALVSESDAEPVLAAIEEACHGREEAPTPAVEGLKCRALTNPQRKALLAALKPSGWKGLYKLRTAEQLATELAAYVGGEEEGISIREFVEKHVVCCGRSGGRA